MNENKKDELQILTKGLYELSVCSLIIMYPCLHHKNGEYKNIVFKKKPYILPSILLITQCHEIMSHYHPSGWSHSHPNTFSSKF
jgi:hypothetical protein